MTTTATITSLGVGSGLDLNTMVTQLVAIERQPLTTMQTAASKLQAQVSSIGKIQSLLGTLQDASNALTSNSLWTRGTATSSDSSSVGVVAATNAGSGTYSVAVQSLASSQTLSSSAVFSKASDLVGSGTLTFTLGSWGSNPTSFSAKTGATAVSVTATATDTVQTLRDKINAAGAGVTATLVTDSSGVRLALQSSSSGVANGFQVTAADADGSDTDAAGLSRFAYDPTASAASMSLVQSAADAKASVNGIAVTSASNDLSGVVEGLTLTLSKVTATPVSIGVTADRDGVKTAVKAFADAYNALVTYIAGQTKYNADTKVAGALQGDSAATGLQSRLRSLLAGGTNASTTFSQLSSVGLQAQRDGTLSVNDTLLTAATNNLPELKKAFAASDSTVAANNGFARRYADLATKALGVDGLLTTRTEGLQKLISKNGDDQDRLNDRVDRFQARLIAQYTAMDAQVAKLNALNTYVTQQIKAMTASSSSS